MPVEAVPSLVKALTATQEDYNRGLFAMILAMDPLQRMRPRSFRGSGTYSGRPNARAYCGRPEEHGPKASSSVDFLINALKSRKDFNARLSIRMALTAIGLPAMVTCKLLKTTSDADTLTTIANVVADVGVSAASAPETATHAFIEALKRTRDGEVTRGDSVRVITYKHSPR